MLFYIAKFDTKGKVLRNYVLIVDWDSSAIELFTLKPLPSSTQSIKCMIKRDL